MFAVSKAVTAVAKRRKPPRGVSEPLFSGYSLTAAQASAPAPISPPDDARPIPRATSPRRATPTHCIVRGPRPAAPRASATPLRIAEALGYPARLLAALPAPWTVFCEACLDGHESVPVLVTTCAADYTAARERRFVTLHGAEWAAVAVASELDRVHPADFERWCAMKQRDRSWELTPQVTLGAFIHRDGQRGLTVGEVLRACGASIVDVASASPAPPDFWEAMHG